MASSSVSGDKAPSRPSFAQMQHDIVQRRAGSGGRPAHECVQIVPSTRPIDAIDCGLWLTPTTRDHKDSWGMSLAPRKDGASRTDLLPRQVYATVRALWATPTASADKSIRTPAGARREVDSVITPLIAPPHEGARWWPGHRARLVLGTARLRIALPSADCIDTELHDWLSLHRDAVVKLVITRGSGGRAYAPSQDAPPVWMHRWDG